MQTYLSVLIPAFNEEGVIAANLREVMAYLEKTMAADQWWEVVVVDDGSTDGTAEILDSMAGEEPRLVVVHHPRNLGRGRAVRSGFERSRGLYAVVLDADLSYSPCHIAKMLVPLEAGEADMIIASPYHPQGEVCNVPPVRLLLSRCGNWLFSLSLKGKLHTVTCVVRAYSREVIDNLLLASNGKDLHLEIIQKAALLGYRIREVPARLEWRPAKRSTNKKTLSARAVGAISSSHLFYSFLYRPSQLLVVPTLVLFLGSVLGLGVLAANSLNSFVKQYPDVGILRAAYSALRSQILDAPAASFVTALCLVLAINFVALIFLAKQNRHYFDEVYRYLNAIDRRLKTRSRETKEQGEDNYRVVSERQRAEKKAA